MPRFIFLAVGILCLISFSQSSVQAAAECKTETQKMDIPKVRDVRVSRMWLSWINRLRKAEGVPAVKYSDALNATALEWSSAAAFNETITHSRPGQTTYYDYPRMVTWFAERGLTFENVSGITFTENIGWGTYSCKEMQRDCTGNLIRSIRSTLSFYLAEKNKEYRPHYNSIMNPKFAIMGLGIALNTEQNKYFLTVHYGTKIVNECEK